MGMDNMEVVVHGWGILVSAGKEVDNIWGGSSGTTIDNDGAGH